MKERKLGNTAIGKMTGTNKYKIGNMFYRFDGEKYVNKTRAFVDKLEEALGLPEGSMSE